MKKYLVGLLSTMVWLGSCDSQTKTNDIVTKDIPLSKSGKPYSYYNNKSNVENKLGITTIENGFDSVQIRIWYGYAFTDSSQLVILKKSNNTWSGELLSLIYNLNDKGDSLKSISKSSISSNPLHGWSKLIKALYEQQIHTLPDDSKINGYPDMMDGDAVIVEIATKNTYRIYSYKQPASVQNKFEEARRMEKILEIIESEFLFPRLRKF